MPYQELKPLNMPPIVWKVYIWTYFLLALLTVLMSFSYYKSDFVALLRLSISFVLILGVFGFAYSKPFFSQRFWKLFLFVAIVDEFIDVTDLIYMNETQRWAQLIKYAIVLPCFVAVFRYAYRLDAIWKEKKG